MLGHFKYHSIFDLCIHELLLVLQFIGIQYVENPFLFQHCTLISCKTTHIKNITFVRQWPKIGVKYNIIFPVDGHQKRLRLNWEEVL
jgi:hypothetical protein